MTLKGCVTICFDSKRVFSMHVSVNRYTYDLLTTKSWHSRTWWIWSGVSAAPKSMRYGMVRQTYFASLKQKRGAPFRATLQLQVQHYHRSIFIFHHPTFFMSFWTSSIQTLNKIFSVGGDVLQVFRLPRLITVSVFFQETRVPDVSFDKRKIIYDQFWRRDGLEGLWRSYGSWSSIFSLDPTDPNLSNEELYAFIFLLFLDIHCAITKKGCSGIICGRQAPLDEQGFTPYHSNNTKLGNVVWRRPTSFSNNYRLSYSEVKVTNCLWENPDWVNTML